MNRTIERKHYAVFVFCMLLFLCKAIFAQNPKQQNVSSYINRYVLSSITMQDGLPHIFVDDVMKDSKGYLWLSTMGGGVARYDVNEFVNFNTNSNIHKLKSNFVSFICEDKSGRLWMAGEQGIDVISINTLEVVTEDISLPGSFEDFLDFPVSGMMISSAGNIWICSRNILYKVILSADGDISEIIKVSSIRSNERGAALCEVNGYIWFQKDSNICMVSENTDKWHEEAQIVSSSLKIIERQSVFCIYNQQNEVWIGTSHGILRYNMMTDNVKIYMYDRNNIHSLSQNYVTDITSTSDGIIIVATLMGINIYNSTTDNFEHIMHDDDNKSFNELNSNFVNVLYSDMESNIVWIGTESGGLSRMSPSRLYVTNYCHQPNHAGSLSKNLVNAIAEDEEGKLWVGVVEGGLNCKLPGEDSFMHYTTDAPAYLSHNSVSSLCLDNKDRLYVGTWGGGIGWIDRRKSASKRFHQILDVNDMFVSTVVYDSLNNIVWIGTLNNVYTYNPVDNSVSRPFEGKETETININALGGCITKDGNLWISSAFGLLRIDLRSYSEGKLEYHKYVNRFVNPESHERERVTCIFQSKSGDIWIGSNGGGIYQVEKKGTDDYSFTSYTTSDGLISNNVRGILEDWYGNIWITTINGLSKYNPKEKIFSSYTSKDGLASDLFYWNGVASSFSGDKIYLGSVGGLSEVHPVIEKEKASDFPLVINKINVFDKVCYPKDNVLELHERDKSLSIEFAALDYNPSSLASYSYRLLGFDDKWVYVGDDRRTVTYTNLRPGKYKFQLRYTSDGKNWISDDNDLIIEVAPYFYKTAWFVISIGLLIIFVAYRVVIWRFNQMKRQQEILHFKVEERTKELKEQQKLLSRQTIELSDQNQLLKEQNAKITEQKNKILEMSRKVEELTIDKLAFFTNITHEFRTPLTLIVGPIERALKLSYNPQVIEQLNLVERNCKYLLSLVNQLLDFRKVEENKMKIICHHGNMERFIMELTTPFKDFAKNKGIELRIFLRLENPYLMFDEDIMRKVMINLISNAIKFTEKDGVVSVYATILPCNADSEKKIDVTCKDGTYEDVTHKDGTRKCNEKLYICVRDTGRGIPEEDVEKIFNQFYQSENQIMESVSGQSGTGIGLYLCKKLITLLGGSIVAKNNTSSGSSFRISLPVDRGNTSSQDIHEDDAEYDDHSLILAKNGKLTVLIVEDNKDMRDYIRSILVEYYNVLEASQGEEALQILKTVNVDFIISDLMMPVMDGMELSRRVRSDFSISHIPFLMLTAKTSDESRLESYKTGVDSYLLKPFDENLLLARISNILENRKRFQQKFSITMDIDSLEIDNESSDKKFLDKAMKVVKENYKNADFEVADFIEAMGISKTLLNKKMQSLTGQSANQFMRNYRLNLARELLLKNKVTHNMNISEIAYEVGFNDPKYFTRCFTKHFNVTPSSLMGDK